MSLDKLINLAKLPLLICNMSVKGPAQCQAHDTECLRWWPHPWLNSKGSPDPEVRLPTASTRSKTKENCFLCEVLTCNRQNPYCKVIYLLPRGSCLEGLPALFQADFPNINICQELTQSQGCKITLWRRKGEGSSQSQGRDGRPQT